MNASDVTNHVTGVLMVIAIVGVIYMWRYRHVEGGHYKLLGWAALATVATTVWVGRIAHAYVEPRSLITPFLLFGWTISTIFVATLFIVTVKRHRRKNGLD